MGQVYPVKDVVLPKDLKGCTNGKLPKETLRKTFPYGEGHWLADQAWRAMCAAAKADGLNLTHVGAYRPFSDQLKMNAHFCTDPLNVRRVMADARRVKDNAASSLVSFICVFSDSAQLPPMIQEIL